MKKLLGLMIAGSLVLSACSKDDDNTSNPATELSATDREFATKAWMSNYFEIQGGQLAVTKATDLDIEEFGEHMIEEHGTSRTELQTIATSLNLYTPDSLDNEDTGVRAQLIDLDGRSFDSTYIHAQVRAHQKTIAIFQTEITGGKNSRLVSYAQSQMPHLQMHLQMADSIADRY